MTKDELLKVLDELFEATPAPRSVGMISSGSIRRIRLSGDDVRMALDLALEIVRATPANRIERASESIEGRYPGLSE